MAAVNDIGIDLGTSNVLFYMKGKGIVLREPAVVAIERDSKKILAVGSDAYRMIGRTPGNVLAIRPLRQGTVTDFDLTNTLLKYFTMHVIGRHFFSRPRAVISVPSGVNEVEKRSIISIMFDAGMRRTQLLDRPIAAALGAGLQFEEAYGTMIIDMGAGVTDIAVLSLGQVTVSSCVPIGGDYFDDAIIRHLRKKYNLLIGERTAEEIKISIGSAYPYEDEGSVQIKGRNLVDGLPKNVTISASEVREALADPLVTIVDAIKSTLEKTPPELSADIIDHGIMLTGGGALLRGLDLLVAQETGMPVHVAESPLDCVVDGTGKRLEVTMPKEYYKTRRR